jgi:GrpB-like predicted nucleotidyltransferase (UPF0157 family)
VPSQIQMMDYDPRWPEIFRREADQIRTLLGCRALRIEHTGSTSVPGLTAKPITGILLVVADSSAERAYVPILELFSTETNETQSRLRPTSCFGGCSWSSRTSSNNNRPAQLAARTGNSAVHQLRLQSV